MHLDVAKQRGCKRNRANPSSVLNIQTSIYMTNTPREDLKKQRDANDDTPKETHARKDNIEAMEVEAGRQNYSLDVPKLNTRDWRSV